jgi:hypothetical protein
MTGVEAPNKELKRNRTTPGAIFGAFLKFIGGVVRSA